MKKNFRFYKILSLTCALISLLLIALSNTVKGFSNVYAKYVYPLFVNTIGRFFSIFPFSVFEIFLYAAVIFLCFSVVFVIFLFIKKKNERVKLFLTRFVCAVCVLGLLMTLTAGINYGRDSIADLLSMDQEKHTKEELVSLASILIGRANETAGEVYENYDEYKLSRAQMVDGCVDAMKSLSADYSGFSGFYARPKSFLYSKGMSAVNITGVFSPFTIEANYSDDVVDYLMPFTICHELAHSKGFMKEEDANFIAYLATRSSKSPILRLSGEINALIYTLNALNEYVDNETYVALYRSIDTRILAEIQKDYEYWQQYEGPVAEISTKVNDVYLKVNAQKEGVRSYGLMVDLVFSLYKDEIRSV